MSKTAHFKIPTWRTAAILKIVKLPYLSEKSSSFDEIWYTASDIEPVSDIFSVKEWRDLETEGIGSFKVIENGAVR